MREIEFRGKLINSKIWAYGNLDIKKNKTAIITPDDTPLGRYGEVDTETVGQYTGLKDKNGVKIFEGDIVRSYADVFRAIVEYNTSFAGWFPFCNERTGIYADECEVIGNIHDNPELLEGE